MARIRTIKPDFFRSAAVADLSRDARIQWVGMWCAADDAGRLRDDARLIKSDVWPLDDDMTAPAVSYLLDELAEKGRIVRYTVDGKGYIQIVGWKHQRINKPTPSLIPPMPDGPEMDAYGTVPLDITTLSELSPEDSATEDGMVTVGIGSGNGNGSGKGGGSGKPGRPARRPTTAPDRFPITEAMTEWHRENAPHLDLRHETDKFLSHHQAKGTTFKDWNAAWRNWMTRAVEYSPPPKHATYRPPATQDADGVPILVPDGWGNR